MTKAPPYVVMYKLYIIYVYMYYICQHLGPGGSNTLTTVCPYMVRPQGVMYDPAVARDPRSRIQYACTQGLLV